MVRLLQYMIWKFLRCAHSQLGRLAARLREIDSDTESEVDDIVGSSSVSTALPDASGQDDAATEPWDDHDSSKSDVAELDTSVFLSFACNH
ncbi:unnamed protein product [Prunus armeniaca]|uniref:Uncharacterized protein n=1 Tax=Prunus armeniaca TaxID=36596 RepID=A0A6J5X7C7_PRUAR|nr:unnamed protein product [Prunus armeniaca]